MNIPIPGVVVIGEQSSGKSSVLESICGIEFPRAENTCTRMPCVVQLMTSPGTLVEYAMASMDPSFTNAERFSIDRIQDKIRSLTEKHASGNAYIATQPIHVRVVRKEGPELSFIDLPGVTHMSTRMKDIHAVTIQLVEEYVSQEELVILCVLPAMSDFGNAEVLKLARQYDPNGTRTLGVVTKCDDAANAEHSDVMEKVRMSRSTDTRLTLGFHCVVNRSQAALNQGIGRQELLRKEAQVFTQSMRFRALEENNWGISRLTEKIAAIQSKRINACLPKITIQVSEKLDATMKELADLPQQVETREAQAILFASIWRNTCTDIERRVRGDFLSSCAEGRQLAIAPRVDDFVKTFRDNLLKKNPKWLAKETIDNIRGKMHDFHRGYTVDNLVGPSVFMTLVQHTFVEKRMLHEAVESLTEHIALLLNEVLASIVGKHAANYPSVLWHISDLGRSAIQQQKATAQKLCWAMADAQVVTSTTNEEYDSNLVALKRAMFEDISTSTSRWRSSSTQETNPGCIPPEFLALIKKTAKEHPEDLMVLETAASLYIYSQTMLSSFIEMSSKLVQHNLVVKLSKELELLCQKDMQGDISDLFPIDKVAACKRAELEAAVKSLREALDMLESMQESPSPRRKRARIS